MAILVTGVAGFIGMYVARALLARGERVIGVDSLTPYYDVALKRARLAQLEPDPGFRAVCADIAVPGALDAVLAESAGVDRIVHLAAQPGVRHSLEAPRDYVTANVAAQLEVLEAARRLDRLTHLVYASSSAVYGGNTKHPFSVGDRTDDPISLYGATKKAGETMARSYANLYGLPATGLRFFTVYGPWGRPDMAPMIFTRRILAGQAIPVFNEGRMARDFTYVDDITAGVLAALDRPPADTPPHRLYNLGNSRTETLMRFIEVLGEALGVRPRLDLQPAQPGDVIETAADITESTADLGFRPTTPIEDGLPRFVAWYRGYYGA